MLLRADTCKIRRGASGCPPETPIALLHAGKLLNTLRTEKKINQHLWRCHPSLMAARIHGIFASILQMDEFHGVSPEGPTKENTL